MTVLTGSGFYKNFRFVRCFNRRVVTLNLMDFPVNTGGKSITHLPDTLVSLKGELALRFRLLDFILKEETGLRFALIFIKDALFL